MLINEKDIKKLEFSALLEDFANYSYLDKTKSRFLEFSFLNEIDKYNLAKENVTRFSDIIHKMNSMHEYEIAGVDVIAARISEMNGYMSKSDINPLRNSFRFACEFYKIDREFFNDLTSIEVIIDGTKKIYDHLCKLTDKEGEIASSASNELANIRKEKEELVKRQDKILGQIYKKYEKYLMEENITLFDKRIVLQVDIRNKNSVGGVLHSYSNTGKTAFVEPEELVFYNNRLTELQQEEEAEIAKILERAREMILADRFAVIILERFIPEADYMNSINSYMNNHDAVYAEISDSIVLYNAYHPMIKKAKGKNAVPLNIEIGDGSSLLVTGPNMGGKTALLKTIGIIALSVRKGLPIIASEYSKMPFFSNILADIGDDQSIEEGISTFASHIRNYKRFVDLSKPNTLILLDEIGTGTAIKEGSSFAISTIEFLMNKNAVVIFTSHFDAIKEYVISREDKKIKYAAMKYDYEKNAPYFQIEMNSLGDSGVFNLLSQYDFPDEIISNAKNMLGDNYIKYTELLELYKAKIKSAEDMKESLELRQKAIMKIEGIVNYQRKELEEKLKRFEKELAVKKTEEIENMRSEFEKIVKEIREMSASKDKIKEMSAFLEQSENSRKQSYSNQKTNQIKEGASEFTEGDMVVLNSNVEGIIEKFDSENAVININGVRLTTKKSNIIGKVHKKLKDDFKVSYKDELITNEVDVRGMYPEDAIASVERFILRAKAEDLNEVLIIHGHGTGVLKREIRKYLKSVKFIKSFDSGRDLPGGDGVTLVKLL